LTPTWRPGIDAGPALPAAVLAEVLGLIEGKGK
jgi:hypothetical protein